MAFINFEPFIIYTYMSLKLARIRRNYFCLNGIESVTATTDVLAYENKRWKKYIIFANRENMTLFSLV